MNLKLLSVISTSVAVFAIVMLTGCAANKLKRAERLINKAEELGAKWHVDTVTVEVPVFVPETRVDSIIVSKPGDTVVITKDRLKLKYVRLQGDTVFIAAECAADTIYKKVSVTVVKTIKAKGGIKWWWLLVALAAGTFLGRFVIKALLG
jgi:hypothetical protein